MRYNAHTTHKLKSNRLLHRPSRVELEHSHPMFVAGAPKTPGSRRHSAQIGSAILQGTSEPRMRVDRYIIDLDRIETALGSHYEMYFGIKL